MSDPLPIDAVIDDVHRALGHESAVVLQAPPGSGKTTRVPLALLGDDWLGDLRIVMLEPRRIAARAAADYMARSLNEQVGATVGFRTRDHTRVSAKTRVEVVTEGVLTRMIQSDPGLDGVGLVIFDEFHERSLAADIGLAFCLETQSVLRPDLRLMVMSATIDTGAVAGILGSVPIVRAPGRVHPIDTAYRPRTPSLDIESDVVAVVVEAMATAQGDILTFLPGTGWIRRTQRLLSDRVDGNTVVTPLYGLLDSESQDLALQPDRSGRRKIVLATSIAETSVTIDGVSIVVDSGLSRVPRFDPASGMTRLETVRVSQATAEQRQGRAGRQGPGLCYRLWSAHDHQHLRSYDAPEIASADLTGLRLELARWGAAEAHELSWLDAPPAAALAEATELLRLLGALDADGRITPHGRSMADFGTEPRLAHLMLEGHRRGHGALACDIAALLGGRDPLAGNSPHDPDLRTRLDLLGQDDDRRGRWGARQEARRASQRWRRQLGPTTEQIDPDATGLLVSLAYPERIAVARGPRGSFHMANGKGAQVVSTDPLARETHLAIAEVTSGAESHIQLAAPIELDEIRETHGERVTEAEVVQWDRRKRDVVAQQHLRLGSAVLQRNRLEQANDDDLAQALLDGVRREGLGLLPWTDDDRRWQARVVFLAKHMSDWPDLRDDQLAATLDDWLLPHLRGRRRRSDLDSLEMRSVLSSQLTWRQSRDLERLAPTHIEVPSGSRVPVDYRAEDGPVLAVRLQEMFGCRETPTVAGQPVVLHLLSPAHRPMQVTTDLASFWENTYPSVKAELAGRYRKHHWPDDPVSAEPTNRTKRPGR